MSSADGSIPRPWATDEPDRLVGRGHHAGDLLEAWRWTVIDEDDGHLRVSAHLPDHLLNLRGQLFGGFTPTYVDLVALFTLNRRPHRRPTAPRRHLATTSMRIDYFTPIVGPTFTIDSRRELERGRTHVVITRFFQDDDLAVLATTTWRELAGADPVSPSPSSAGPSTP